jgi:hypothetical protein
MSTSSIFVPWPFCISLIVSLFKSNNIQPLNCRGFTVLRASLGFVVKFAFVSSLSSSIANLLFNRPRVLSVYIATMLNRSLFVDIRRQGSYVDDSIDSFSL